MNKKVNVYLMCIIVFLQGFIFYGPIATLYRQNRNLSLSDMFLIESTSNATLTILSVIPIFGSSVSLAANLIICNTAEISISWAFITCVVMYVLAYILLYVYKKVLNKSKGCI